MLIIIYLPFKILSFCKQLVFAPCEGLVVLTTLQGAQQLTPQKLGIFFHSSLIGICLLGNLNSLWTGSYIWDLLHLGKRLLSPQIPGCSLSHVGVCLSHKAAFEMTQAIILLLCHFMT